MYSLPNQILINLNGNDSFCFFFINGHNLIRKIVFFFSIDIVIENMFHQTNVNTFILNGIKM